MPKPLPGGNLELADDLTVSRVGYGAMQLAGPGVWGPPKDLKEAIAVLREAVELGITHIDTSDYYGPYIVNLRVGGLSEPTPGSIAEPFAVLAELQQQGLIRHLGVSVVSPEQLTEAQSIAPVVCVQNFYNLANRADDQLVDRCARKGIAYTPFFPLGGFSPLQSEVLDRVASRLDATPFQIALAWLLQRSPTILLIPGTSSVAHLRENVAGAGIELPSDALEELNSIGA